MRRDMPFFIYWKSPTSQPLIKALNSFLPMEIGRTVDMSDLLALMVLPFSYLYFAKPFLFKFYPAQVLMMGLAAFAFMATSKRKITVIEYSKTWNFDVSKNDLKLKMMALDVMEIKFMQAAEYTLYKDSVAMKKYHFTTTDTNQILKTLALDIFQDEQELVFSDTLLPIHYEALIKLQGKGNTSSLEVKHFKLWEIDDKIVAEQKKLVPVHFEQQVIEKLK